MTELSAPDPGEQQSPAAFPEVGGRCRCYHFSASRLLLLGDKQT